MRGADGAAQHDLEVGARDPRAAHRATLDEVVDAHAADCSRRWRRTSRAELWEQRHPGEPTRARPALAGRRPRRWSRVERVTMVVQVNGKVRARLEVAPTSRRRTPRPRWRWPTRRSSPRSRGRDAPARRRAAAAARQHHRLMAQRGSVERRHVEPPRFDRPEVEIRASTRRKKTGTAHWSGSRIVVQIPARLRGRERARFVDDLVERLLTQRPQNAAGDASLEERARVLAELYNDGVERRVGALGDQPASPLGVVLAGDARDPRLESAAPVPRVGDRRGAGPRARAPARGRPLGGVLRAAPTATRARASRRSSSTATRSASDCASRPATSTTLVG